MRVCVICEIPIGGQKVKFCSNKCKQKDHWYRIKGQQNTYHSQTIRSYKRKIALIELSGGGCQRCGYNKNISALHFHHRNPNEKLFQLDSRKLSNTKWDIILEEHSKCDLLCGNCHSEEHNPEMDINNVKKIINKKLELV